MIGRSVHWILWYQNIICDLLKLLPCAGITMELLTEEQWMLDISSFSIAPHKGQPKIESVVALLLANYNYFVPQCN